MYDPNECRIMLGLAAAAAQIALCEQVLDAQEPQRILYTVPKRETFADTPALAASIRADLSRLHRRQTQTKEISRYV